MFALSELEQKVQAMRPKLDAKYSKIAPVTWDVEKKDRDLRFNEDYVYTFDDGRKLRICQWDPEQNIASTVWTAAIALSNILSISLQREQYRARELWRSDQGLAW